MTNTAKKLMILGVALIVAPVGWADNPKESRLERQLRRELITLPYYSVFDTLSFRVDDGVVTLLGKVSRPTLKTDAENVVKRIEGVASVRNEIEVLPVSPNDDRLRFVLYRAIYGHTALETLAIRPVPPIAIIVKNGNVVLEGVVLNHLQRAIAASQANTVAGVFSVTDNLRVEPTN